MKLDAKSVMKTTMWLPFLLLSNTIQEISGLPPFSLIRDFGKQNTRGNVSEISGLCKVRSAWRRMAADGADGGGWRRMAADGG